MAETENSTASIVTVSNKLDLKDVIKQIEANLFPTVFVIATLLNVAVIVGLVKAKVHISTKMLMIYQACNNVIGLGANGIYYPIVINYGGYPEPLPSIWHNLPGAFTLGAIYSGMAILLFIAVQRVCFLFFPMWGPDAFTIKVTLRGIIACMLFGFAWAIHCLWDCCRFEYSLTLGKWLYSAQMAQIQGKAVLVTMAVFPIATSLLYMAAGVKLVYLKHKSHKVDATVHVEFANHSNLQGISFVEQNVHLHPKPLKHTGSSAKERKILLQFAIISVVWCVYSTMFNIIQQIPSVRKSA